MSKSPNTKGVRAALASAEPVAPRSAARKSGERGAPDAPVQWSGVGLPDGCPVRAVGLQKTTCIILDALGQLIEAGPRDLGQSHLSVYFAGDIGYLAAHWPYKNKDQIWLQSKFTPEAVQRSIQLACSEAGIWADFEKVRGRGAWRDDDKRLVLHCGDVVIFHDGIEKPDVWNGHVYPAGGPITRPLPATITLPPAHSEKAAGPALLEIFKTWAWRRPVLDPRLFLGALVASMVGGALHWRPSCWITGESGSGKTTLMNLRRDVCAGWSFNAENASESGISTMIGFDAIGVSLDEQENSQDNRMLLKIVELMRLAASGALKVRGSASHAGHAFRSRNSFIASSINAAPLKNQDMNRMARLELETLSKDAVKPSVARHQAQRWGAEILRRCMEQWHRFDATLEAYQRDLGTAGHDQRGQDTFGVLLACADLVLAEENMLDTGADPDRNALWQLLETDAMPEYADRMASWQACLQHLLSSRPREWKSPGPTSIGEVCADFVRARKEGDASSGGGGDLKWVNGLMGLAGLSVFVAPRGPFQGKWCLGVPNQHPALAPIFDPTDWRGEASTIGGWIAALGRGDPDVIMRHGDTRFRVAGQQLRGVWVCLERATSWKRDREAPEELALAR